MTGIATLGVAMLVQLFANRHGAADIRLKARYVGWWRPGRSAEYVLHGPNATQDRGGIGAVGRYLEHRALGEARRRGRNRLERNLGQGQAFHAVDIIVPGNPFVQDGEIRVQQVDDAQVIFEQAPEERLAFPKQAVLQQFIVFPVEFSIRSGLVYFSAVATIGRGSYG